MLREPRVCVCVCWGYCETNPRRERIPNLVTNSCLSYLHFFSRLLPRPSPPVFRPRWPAVCNGGVLVFPRPRLRLSLSWEHMTGSINKATSLPKSEPNSPACQSPPNQLLTTPFPRSYDLQSAEGQTKYLLPLTAEL